MMELGDDANFIPESILTTMNMDDDHADTEGMNMDEGHTDTGNMDMGQDHTDETTSPCGGTQDE